MVIKYFECIKCGDRPDKRVVLPWPKDKFTYTEEELESMDWGNCEKCGGKLKNGWTIEKTDFVNICRDGDFKEFYSPDLGVRITSAKQLGRVLKEKGMVNLMESREYRDSEKTLQAKAKEMLGRPHWQKELK